MSAHEWCGAAYATENTAAIGIRKRGSQLMADPKATHRSTIKG